MNENLLVEKRCAPRRSSERHLTVHVGERVCAARCLDQSPGGMRLACPVSEPIEPGDTLGIVSLEPDLSFQGRVAWTRVVGDVRQVGVEREEPVIFSLERRRYVRVAAPDLTASLGLQRIRVLDVSLRGLRVEISESLEGQVQLDLHLPGAPLALAAEVLESRGSIARLALTDVDEAAHERLADYLRTALRSSS